jgi:hypothetical protein
MQKKKVVKSGWVNPGGAEKENPQKSLTPGDFPVYSWL